MKNISEIQKKKVVIIGAGVSGMSAGIYCLDNGFDVEIFEKHFIAGGQCTGWTRDGVFIDGCAHWVVGTNPNSDLYPLWYHIGALNDQSIIHETEYFTKYVVGNETVTFYSDIDKLKAELLRVAPEDKKLINRFINDIKAYQHVRIPLNKPIDYMNLFELTNFGIQFLPLLGPYLRLKKMNVRDFSSKFKSPILKEVFLRVLDADFNFHSFVYIMQALCKRDAGVIEGGSLKMANNILKTYESKGGKIHFNSEVQEIVIENNVAKGIILKNGEKIDADYVVSACDAHFMLNTLLKGKYKDKYFDSKFSDLKNNPLNACMLFSYKVTKSGMYNYPKMVSIPCDEFEIGDTKVRFMSIRNHAYDKTLNGDASTLIVMIPTKDGTYDYFKAMDKKTYRETKAKFAELIRIKVKDYFEMSDDEIKCIDVTTPLTYERYTNAYRGSYMAFISTNHPKKLMRPGLIKGLKNFVIAGQWIMDPGGLPIALFSGKHAAIRICKMNKQKFVNKEEKAAKLKLFFSSKYKYTT